MDDDNLILERKNFREMNLPSILYKYRNWEEDNHKRVLTHNELFFAEIIIGERMSDFNPKRKIVPELRLCGNWLENAGFSPTNYVSVTVMDKLLIIRSIEELEDEKENKII